MRARGRKTGHDHSTNMEDARNIGTCNNVYACVYECAAPGNELVYIGSWSSIRFGEIGRRVGQVYQFLEDVSEDVPFAWIFLEDVNSRKRN